MQENGGQGKLSNYAYRYVRNDLGAFSTLSNSE